MHCTNIVMPCCSDLSVSRTVLIRSIKICLSVRVLFGSLRPGESINVMLPLFAILGRDVTETKDFEASNFKGFIDLINSALFISDIFVSRVDLPCPHSPKTANVKSSSLSRVFAPKNLVLFKLASCEFSYTFSETFNSSPLYESNSSS